MADECCSSQMRLLRAYVEDSACIVGTVEGARENLDRKTATTATTPAATTPATATPAAPATDLRRGKSYVWCNFAGGDREVRLRRTPLRRPC